MSDIANLWKKRHDDLKIEYDQLSEKYKILSGALPQNDKENIFTVDSISVNVAQAQIKLKGENIPLTTMEFSICTIFLRNPGRKFTRLQILNMVWSQYSFVKENTRSIDVHISRINKKFGENIISSVKNFGYFYKQ